MNIIEETKTDDVAGKVLGQRVSAPQVYDPNILVRVPRSENRKQYGISDDTFIGFDTWNCYEISFLLNNGFPLMFVGKLVYPSNSEFIVESKSLKLYLNSFNMEKMGISVEDATHRFINTVKHDLAVLLNINIHDVSFNLFDDKEEKSMFSVKPDDYSDIGEYGELCEFTSDSETPELLKENIFNKKFKVSFRSMRSNCRVTHQPDWATVFIDYEGDRGVDLKSLLQYLVSFRNESHFHEECVEMIFTRLNDKFLPDKLNVTALYTRRGGIDICPQRSLSFENLNFGLLQNIMHTRTIHQ